MFSIDQLKSLCKEWNYISYEELSHSLNTQPKNKLFTTCNDQEIVGIIYYQEQEFFTEIYYVYLIESQRGKGLALKMMTDFFNDLKARYKEYEVFLEVRGSNEKALSLYYNLGMEQIGFRKNYYEGKEDALILRLIW